MLMKKCLSTILNFSLKRANSIRCFSQNVTEIGLQDSEKLDEPVEGFSSNFSDSFDLSVFRSLLESEKDNFIETLINLDKNNNFNEFIMKMIQALGKKEGIEFWKSLERDDKLKIINYLFEIKKEYFGYANRIFNTEFFSNLCIACKNANDYDIIADITNNLLEMNKSLMLKISVIQNFFYFAKRNSFDKKNPIVRQTVESLEEEMKNLLFSNNSYDLDMKTINLNSRCIVDYLVFIFHRFPTSSKNTNLFIDYFLKSKIQNLNPMLFIKCFSLILEITNKGYTYLRIEDEANLYFLNELLEIRKNFEDKNERNRKESEEETKITQMRIGDVIRPDVLNNVIQGYFLKNEENWRNKTDYLNLYSEFSRLSKISHTFGKWVGEKIKEELHENLTKSEADKLVTVLAQLTTYPQEKQLKLFVLKENVRFIDSAKKATSFVSNLKLICSFLRENKSNNQKQDYSKDALSPEDKEFVMSYLSKLEQNLNKFEKNSDLNDVLELVNIYQSVLKLKSIEEFKTTWIHQRFLSILLNPKSLSSLFSKVISNIRVYDLKTDTEMMSALATYLENQKNMNQMKNKSTSTFNKKRIEQLLTELRSIEGMSEECSSILRDIETTCKHISEFQRRIQN